MAPLGEFPHRPSGVVQVVDKDACDAMTNAFSEQAKQANFAGLLIDFDHFSLDDKLKSEAAGWITEPQNRDNGLWAKIRWSDASEQRYKWTLGDSPDGRHCPTCVELAGWLKRSRGERHGSGNQIRASFAFILMVLDSETGPNDIRPPDRCVPRH